jgi:hypothetical protein
MRYAWIGFHVVMLALLVMALTGGFSPPKTGNMMQDNGSTIMPTIGIVTLWVVGAIIFRIVRRFSRY